MVCRMHLIVIIFSPPNKSVLRNSCGLLRNFLIPRELNYRVLWTSAEFRGISQQQNSAGIFFRRNNGNSTPNPFYTFTIVSSVMIYLVIY